MALLRKLTVRWDITTGHIECDSCYLKREERLDVDLYVTDDGTAYALATGWGLNLTIKPKDLGDNDALVAVTSWVASATTGLYQATAQAISSTELDTYLAANNAKTDDDIGPVAVDVDVYYTISAAPQAKSDTRTLWLKPDVGRADDGTPITTAVSITSSGYTMTTQRWLGRWSSGTGPIQEGTFGTGLSLSAGGVLSATASAITTTNILYVDAAGSDANAGTIAAPFLTLGAAKAAATSGALVIVRPGTYSITASILKDGVTWQCYGCTINFTNNATDYGPLDDGGSAITCTVFGGIWNRTETSAGTLSDPTLAATRHSSSNVDLSVEEMSFTSTNHVAGNIESWCVWGVEGRLTVRDCRKIHCSSDGSALAASWSNGNTYISANQITVSGSGQGYGVYSICTATPTGDFFVRADIIDCSSATTGQGIKNNSTQATSAMWVDALIIKSGTNTSSAAVEMSGGTSSGKTYVHAQKLFGLVKNTGSATALIYIETDKWEPMVNQSLTNGLFLQGSDGVTRITARHCDPKSYTSGNAGAFRSAGGVVFLQDAEYTSGASSGGIVSIAGEFYVINSRINTAANSGRSAVTVSGGTVEVAGSKLTSNGAKYDVEQTGGTVTVTGGSGTGTNGAFVISGTVGFTKPATALLADTASAVAVGGITGLGTGVATFLATPSSANLAAAVTDETGSGALVFSISPALTTPNIGAATATTINGASLSLGAGSIDTNIALGASCLAANTTGFQNTALGSAALSSNTTGNYNIAIGRLSLQVTTTGSSNTAIGTGSLQANITGSGNIGIGYLAGRYETGSDGFYVNNQDRTDLSGDRTKSLIYGTFAASAASQQLTFNVGTITATSAAASFGSIPSAGAIGGTTPAAGSFTTLSASGTTGLSDIATVTKSGHGNTRTDGAVLTNTTAASAGTTRQRSPSLHLHASHYASGAPQDIDWAIEASGQHASPSAGSGYLYIMGSVAGGAYNDTIELRQDGLCVLTGTAAGFILNTGAGTSNIYSTTYNQYSAAHVTKWSSNATYFGTPDLGFSRTSAGLMEINNGTASAWRDLKVRQHYVDQTITAGGTTGNQTINKAAGTVNIAAAGTTVTVTCSLCTTSSTVHAVLRTNDATATIKNVVPVSGSFVINLGAAATAEVSIGFLVVN